MWHTEISDSNGMVLDRRRFLLRRSADRYVAFMLSNNLHGIAKDGREIHMLNAVVRRGTTRRRNG